MRTVPAKNPRTEWACHLVIFIIAATVAPPGLRSITSTADCFDDPATIGFADEELKEADFGCNAGSDFDGTLGEVLRVVRRFATATDWCVVFLGLDVDLLAIGPSGCLNDSVRCCHWHNPAEKVGRVRMSLALFYADDSQGGSINRSTFYIFRARGRLEWSGRY